MPNIIPHGFGRHVTSLVVTPQAVAATTGVLTDSTPVAALITSTGTLHTNLVHTAQLSDDIEFAIRNNLEMIQALTRNRVNNVPTTIGGSLTAAEIVRRGTNVALLAGIWFSGKHYCKVQYGRFGSIYTVYMRMRSFRMNPARTKNVDIAEFVLFDANVAPTFIVGQ